MPKWVWVRDESTGHEYDVEASTLPWAGLTPVEGVDPVEGPGVQPRPAKPFVGKDDQPAIEQAPVADGPGQDDPPTGTANQEATPANEPADKPADTKQNRSTR